MRLRSQLASLHRRAPIVAVVEDRGNSIDDLYQAFTDGVHAITLLSTLGRTGVVSLFELAPYARLFAESAPAEILAYIDARRGRWGVEPICTELQFAPSTYYEAKKRPISERQRRCSTTCHRGRPLRLGFHTTRRRRNMRCTISGS